MELWYMTLSVFLCLLSAVHCLECSGHEYAWPFENPTSCCDKCPPGKYMVKRCVPTLRTPTKCSSCKDHFYTETYNTKGACDICTLCTDDLVYESKCSTSRNAVCSCQEGHQCREKPCHTCEPAPSQPSTNHTPADTALHLSETVHTSTPVPITTPGTGLATNPRGNDRKWILICVLLSCLSLGLLLTVCLQLYKRGTFWIPTTNSFWVPKKTTLAHLVAQEEEVPMPIQEVHRKTETEV